MNLHHLRIFHTVANYESYSRAAEALGISQPAVSIQVRKLEESLGLPLVVQVGRASVLTDAGQTLKRYADRIFRLDAEAEAAMAEHLGLRRGHLRVGASSTPGSYLLPLAISRFAESYPGVQVTLTLGNSEATRQRLLEGCVDLAVVGEEPDPHPALRREELLRDCLVLVAAPAHRWAGGRPPTSLADLSNERLIVREPGSSTRKIWQACMEGQGVALAPFMELASTEAVKQAVAAGLGVSVLSVHAVSWELECGKLVRVDLPGFPLERSLFLTTLAERENTVLMQAFLTHLQALNLGGCC